MNTTQIYDIIIPIFNGYEYLNDLFSSLRDNTTTSHRLIIINDASTDMRVVEFLKDIKKFKNSYCTEVICHHNSKNIGFVRSVNFGYKLTKNHFIILNSDTQVPYEWLERLISPFKEHDNIASITPLTNSGTICSFPIWLEDNSLPFGLTLHQIDNVFKIENDQTKIETPTGVGFCMAINHLVAKQIGFFDEDVFYRGYAEENDWCMRAKENGYKNIIIRNLFVYHKHAGSFGKEKQELIKRNHRLLQKRYPDYDKQIETFINQRHMDKLFAKTSLAAFLTHNPAVIFSHNWGGGTELFIKEHLYNSVKNERIVVIRGDNVSNNIEFIENEIKIFQITITTLDEILDILSSQNISSYYMNHFIQYKDIFKALDNLHTFFKKINKHPIYYLHDYFCICPTINLLNSKKRFCGVPNDTNVCNQCLSDNNVFVPHHLPKNIDIQKWREKFGNILNISNKIYSFSKCSESYLIKVYPEIHHKIYRYQLNRPQTKIKIHTHDLSNKKTINVGIIGSIGFHKGCQIIEICTILADRLKLPFDFKIIGSSSARLRSLKGTGKYVHNEIPDLLFRYSIDICVVPSIWPETYCYVFDEIVINEYPVITFDIGAPAERCKNYKHGFIARDISARSILNTLIICSKHYGFQYKSQFNSEEISSYEIEELLSSMYNYGIMYNNIHYYVSRVLNPILKPLIKILRKIKKMLNLFSKKFFPNINKV